MIDIQNKGSTLGVLSFVVSREIQPAGFFFGGGESLRVIILPTGIIFVDCYDCGLAERIGVGESELLLGVKCAQTVKWYKVNRGE